jgi:hypothetical protein
LHLAIALVFFWHTHNFDAGSGERLLKVFFLKIGTNVPTAWSGHFYSPSFLSSSNIDDTEESQEC